MCFSRENSLEMTFTNFLWNISFGIVKHKKYISLWKYP